MTYRPIVLRTAMARPVGTFLYQLGERDYKPIMPLVVGFGGERLQFQEYKPRPDKFHASVVIGPLLHPLEADLTYAWLGTNTKP